MADMVTKQELEAAKIDVKHAGEAVNTKKVITPRYGAPFKSLPLVAAEAQAKADEVVAQGFYRGYTTEALLLAAKPAVAEMRARADDTRKIYRWNRTSAEGVTPVTGNWVDTGLSELDLAKADATVKANNAVAEAVEFSLSDIAAEKRGNLLDASMFVQGSLNVSGAVNTASTTSYTQKYIPMNEFSKYVLETSAGTSLSGGQAICFYDKNKALISGTILYNIPVGSQIVVPSGTYYMRTSCLNANLPTFRISVTTTETTKTNAAQQAAEADATVKANNAVAEAVEFSLSDIAAEKRGNLLDASMFVQGSLNVSGAVNTASTTSYTQKYIPMNEFSKYVLETSAGTSLSGGQAICFYDKNKALISGTILYNIPVGSQIVVPSGTYYMRTSCLNANLPTFRISVTTTETTKTNAAQQAAEADATAKANAVKSYVDSIVSAIDFGTPVMTGQAIYDKSLTTNKVFSAVWSEYNKPVWHIGNSVFVDAVGATVKVVKQEFVMTYKLTEANQTVRAPLVSKDGSTAYVDWGDGTANYVNTVNNLHTYTNAIGDEFVITITGELEVFSIGPSIPSNRTADCIKSIDKNTMPKTTTSFSFTSFPNLVSLCDGAFSSLAGDSLNLELYHCVPKTVTYSNNLFAGLQNVQNIDRLFGKSGTDLTGVTYSPELFKYFTGVTSANLLFNRYKGNLTKEHLEAMTELQYAYRLFAYTKGINSSDILTHQTKLIDVNQCFHLAKSDTASALPIYQHLLNNNLNLTNYVGCFLQAALQDMGSIPAEWK